MKKNLKIKTVPNQRVITIHKEPTDRQHKYTINNLEALNLAVNDLQSKVGIKLYLYFASNQNEYRFALSSSDFCEWAGCGIKAYNTAFEELEKKGYLIQKIGTETIYTFYDKAQNKQPTEEIEENKNTTITEEKAYIPKVEVVEISVEDLHKGFKY